LGAIVLAQHGDQHMGWLDIGMIAAVGERLCVAQSFLKLGGEFVNAHGNSENYVE
jgi:hypothetical protein